MDPPGILFSRMPNLCHPRLMRKLDNNIEEASVRLAENLFECREVLSSKLYNDLMKDTMVMRNDKEKLTDILANDNKKLIEHSLYLIWKYEWKEIHKELMKIVCRDIKSIERYFLYPLSVFMRHFEKEITDHTFAWRDNLEACMSEMMRWCAFDRMYKPCDRKFWKHLERDWRGVYTNSVVSMISYGGTMYEEMDGTPIIF